MLKLHQYYLEKTFPHRPLIPAEPALRGQVHVLERYPAIMAWMERVEQTTNQRVIDNGIPV